MSVPPPAAAGNTTNTAIREEFRFQEASRPLQVGLPEPPPPGGWMLADSAAGRSPPLSMSRRSNAGRLLLRLAESRSILGLNG